MNLHETVITFSELLEVAIVIRILHTALNDKQILILINLFLQLVTHYFIINLILI